MRCARERMVQKLYARQPPSARKKFVIGSDEDALPIKLVHCVSDVLQLRYDDGMAVYPERMFQTIDTLWCEPSNCLELDCDANDRVFVPWHRTRFHINYNRKYGEHTVDILEAEMLPNDFGEPQTERAEEAACTIDIVHRKIAMQFIASENESQGIGRGNFARSNFLSAVRLSVDGWVGIDGFALNAHAFRVKAVLHSRPFLDKIYNNLTRPLVIQKVNAPDIFDMLKTTPFKQCDRMIIRLPLERKTMCMKPTAQERATREAEVERLMATETMRK